MVGADGHAAHLLEGHAPWDVDDTRLAEAVDRRGIQARGRRLGGVRFARQVRLQDIWRHREEPLGRHLDAHVARFHQSELCLLLGDPHVEHCLHKPLVHPSGDAAALAGGTAQLSRVCLLRGQRQPQLPLARISPREQEPVRRKRRTMRLAGRQLAHRKCPQPVDQRRRPPVPDVPEAELSARILPPCVHQRRRRDAHRVICATDHLRDHLAVQQLEAAGLDPVGLCPLPVTALPRVVRAPGNHVVVRDGNCVVIPTRNALHIPSVQQLDPPGHVPLAGPGPARGSELALVVHAPRVHLAPVPNARAMLSPQTDRLPSERGQRRGVHLPGGAPHAELPVIVPTAHPPVLDECRRDKRRARRDLVQGLGFELSCRRVVFGGASETASTIGTEKSEHDVPSVAVYDLGPSLYASS